MKSSSWVVVLLCTTIVSSAQLTAQDLPREVRFGTTDVNGEHQWQGRLERLTVDSLEVRIRGADTLAAFSRTAIHFVERQRRVVSLGRAAAVGCVTGGAALGAAGFLGPNDTGDYSGIRNFAGVVGIVVGCGAGTVGGLVVSVARGKRWEPWVVPADTASSSARPNMR